MYHVYIWTLVFVSGLICPRPAVATTTPRPTTTPSIPTGSCVVDGRIYADGEDVERDVNNCYFATCENGYVSYYDHHCFLDPPVCLGTELQVPGECCKLCITTTPIPTTIPTTTIPTTTTPTTTPHLPPGACEHDGRIYMNGEDVERDVNNCYWATCENGYVSNYDHQCFLDPPVCLGTEIQVPGECCKLCITTTPMPTTIPTTTIPSTTIPTTTPHLPPGACEHDGRIYMNGEDVERDVNNCYWATCDNGYVSFYDHHCFLDPPVCLGTEIEVPGECCKLCITTTSTIPTTIPTTTIPTTTPHLPPGACEYDGRVVLNGEDIERSPCGGLICQDGNLLYWDDRCAFFTPECNGTLIPVEGQCCPLCVQVTTVKPQETRRQCHPYHRFLQRLLHRNLH